MTVIIIIVELRRFHRSILFFTPAVPPNDGKMMNVVSLNIVVGTYRKMMSWQVHRPNAIIRPGKSIKTVLLFQFSVFTSIVHRINSSCGVVVSKTSSFNFIELSRCRYKCTTCAHYGCSVQSWDKKQKHHQSFSSLVSAAVSLASNNAVATQSGVCCWWLEWIILIET